ncbi:Casein kinase I isoform delta [Perkinsus olseni]|uniref:Casein kinase I isoform delta n=1 Tax=Perkinsus olseni TaxID=32597 RepID=A0A7J6SH55_PEROL|nr:Casein kinase I isoform delta [Perkinsus olseni]
MLSMGKCYSKIRPPEPPDAQGSALAGIFSRNSEKTSWASQLKRIINAQATSSRERKVVKLNLNDEPAAIDEPEPPKSPAEVQFHPVVEATLFTPSPLLPSRKRLLVPEGRAYTMPNSSMGVLDLSPSPSSSGRSPRPAF